MWGQLIISDHCSDHFIMYANVKSLCSIPETNIAQQLYYNKKQFPLPSLIRHTHTHRSPVTPLQYSYNFDYIDIQFIY